MKKYIIYSLFLVQVIILGQAGAPKIKVDNPLFDFGNIKEGIYVTHEFTLKNTGSSTLIIERVRASCGCTAAHPDKDSIEPGDSTKIKVTFNTAHRRGKQKKHVYIFTNDPIAPDIRLTFTANIVNNPSDADLGKHPAIKLKKNYHNFGDVEEGDIASVKFEFENSGESELKINEVTASCECTTTYLSSNTLKPGEKGELKIDFDTSDRSGKMTRTVSIKSNDPQYPSKTITLFVNILGHES